METFYLHKDRIGVLIGKSGEVKKEIEKFAGVKININSRTGEVNISTESVTDPIIKLKLKNVINAILFGFTPEKAFKLFSDEYFFENISIKEFVKSSDHIRRLKARVIGTRGKSRYFIEKYSGAYISVYGHYVSIIGNTNSVQIAKTAVIMLLKGSEHSTVYRFLQREKESVF